METERSDIIEGLEVIRDRMQQIVDHPPEGKERWQDPFHTPVYDLNRVIEKAKGELFSDTWKAIKVLEHLDNVPDDEKALEALKKGFIENAGVDYRPLTAYALEVYKTADERALQDILSNATRALPWRNSYDERGSLKIEDILYGVTLRLEINRNDGDNRTRMAYREEAVLVALDKLVWITLYSVRPSMARRGPLYNLFGHGKFDETEVMDDGPYVKARSYKNGRFDLTFRNATEARKIAETLIKNV